MCDAYEKQKLLEFIYPMKNSKPSKYKILLTKTQEEAR